ncbi:hypothetical protein PT974_10435 [Cladobotryum mycophilum]|uniref:Uncharacterized protein n=1 Tax=Cladobotryum mycophilum TaxID=491253 RepID=A0ABR0SAR0_9HYPO
MPVVGLPISTSPIGSRERATDSTESAPTRKTPHLHTRRSVSSMKGLLPLTLTPTCPSPRTNLPLEEGMEPRVDDLLPELLARDLELSKSVFEARSMTSGAPIPTIMTDYRSAAMAFPPRMSSPYRTASLRVQSLGAIEERSSMVSFLDQQEALKCDETASDLDSLTGTEASYDAGPSSFRMREQSIVTNATSLASSSWRPSSKSSRSPDGPRRERSWIEVESDGEEEGDSHDFNLSSLSPRPPTPPTSDGLDAQRHQPARSIAETWRSSPAKSVAKHEPLDPKDITGFPPPLDMHHNPPSRQQSTRRYPVRTNNGRVPEDISSPVLSRASMPESRVTRDVYSDYDDDLVSPIDQQSLGPRRNTIYIRPSPPPSPLPSVQTWLNGSTQPFVLPFQGDELARIVPLPPDAIETLRISTTCFPETMLLSSSLTIETIRSYSRKVRQPSAEPSLLATPPQSPPPIIVNKKSLWRRVVKRGSQSSAQKQRGSHSSLGSSLQSPSSVTLDAPKPWASLKNVFGYCSDYICDALYSHILAYNYVSALVARNPQPSPYGRSRTNDADDIPKKAASLLGLSHSPSVASMGAANRATKRLSSMVTGHSNNDAALRSIQTELLRCIRRLIATARLMAESGSGDDRMMEMETEDNDMLFLRSLCEIVRISEEAAYVC